jgi:hypothetical protein
LAAQALPRFQLFSDLLGYIAGILDAAIDIIDGKKFGECTGASLDLGSDDETFVKCSESRYKLKSGLKVTIR